MPTCHVCSSTTFEKHDGYFYCTLCDTQSQDVREVLFDGREELITKHNVSKNEQKAHKVQIHKYEIGPEWTTWEAYNFILRGLTKQLIAAGAAENIEAVVLQLWAAFLNHERAGFVSRCNEQKPLLSFPYRPRDAKVVHGVTDSKFVCNFGRGLQRQKKTKKTSSRSRSSKSSAASSMSSRQLKKRIITSEYETQLSESQTVRASDLEDLVTMQTSDSGKEDASDDQHTIKRKHMVKTSYRKMKHFSRTVESYRKRDACRPNHNPKRLLAILNLALLVTGSPILLSDLLRFMRDGYISCSEFSQFLPPELRFVTGDVKTLNFVGAPLPTHYKIRTLSCKMMRDLKMKYVPQPDVEKLTRRYATELQLPDELAELAVKVLRLARRNEIERQKIWGGLNQRLPCYEGTAVAGLLVALKILQGLDNTTEYKLSHAANNINRLRGDEQRLFSFTEWQRMIECRYTVLSTWHQPSREVNEPNARFDPGTTCHHLTNSPRDVHLRERIVMKVWDLTRRRRLENDLGRVLPQLKSENGSPTAHISRPAFAPSLTPDTSCIEAIIQHLDHTQSTKRSLPKWVNFLRQDWRSRTIKHLLDSQYLQELIRKHGITLQEDSSEEWLRKYVQVTEKKKDLLDELTDDQLQVKFEVSLCHVVRHSKRRKTIPRIPARWKPKDDSFPIAYSRSDHSYWRLDLDGQTRTYFNQDVVPLFPASWRWLLTKTKRSRVKNFSVEETETLVRLIFTNKDVVEDKRQDSGTWLQKAEVWKSIENSFNSDLVETAATFRDHKSLHSKYESLKKSVKAKFGRNVAKRRKTGGGPPEAPETFTPAEELILDMCHSAITGLDSRHDPDNDTDTHPAQAEPLPLDDEVVWDKYTPSMLRTPVNPSLKRSYEMEDSQDEEIHHVMDSTDIGMEGRYFIVENPKETPPSQSTQPVTSPSVPTASRSMANSTPLTPLEPKKLPVRARRDLAVNKIAAFAEAKSEVCKLQGDATKLDLERLENQIAYDREEHLKKWRSWS